MREAGCSARAHVGWEGPVCIKRLPVEAAAQAGGARSSYARMERAQKLHAVCNREEGVPCSISFFEGCQVSGQQLHAMAIGETALQPCRPLKALKACCRPGLLLH